MAGKCPECRGEVDSDGVCTNCGWDYYEERAKKKAVVDAAKAERAARIEARRNAPASPRGKLFGWVLLALILVCVVFFVL